LDAAEDKFTIELLLRPSKQAKLHEGILLKNASRDRRRGSRWNNMARC